MNEADTRAELISEIEQLDMKASEALNSIKEML